MYRYRRARPKISFALATAMIVTIALVLAGILRIEFDWTPVETNPQAVLIALVLSALAGLLLYEW
ncbi:MAG: hypothetical protein ACUVR4_08850 [Anaerolineae bacterium]